MRLEPEPHNSFGVRRSCLPAAGGPPLFRLQRYRKLIRVLTDRQPTSGTAIFACPEVKPKGLCAFPNLIYRSLSRLRSSNADKSPVPPLILKLHVPRHQRVQRIVLALPNVHASLMLRPALPNQNRPGIHKLSAKALHAQSLPMRIPPVRRRSATLLMCHDLFLFVLFLLLSAWQLRFTAAAKTDLWGSQLQLRHKAGPNTRFSA